MPSAILSIVALLAVIAYTLSVCLFFVLHMAPSPYTFMSHAVSDYGIGPTARLFQLYAGLGTIGAVALTILFVFSHHPVFPMLVPLGMVLMVLSRLGVARFPTDLEGQPRTQHGTLHYVFAILTFTWAYTTIANATPRFVESTMSSVIPVFRLLHTLATVALVGIVVTRITPVRQYFPIAERVFLLATLLWFLLASGAWLVSGA